MESQKPIKSPKRIKITKLIQKLKCSGKMEKSFMEESIKESISILKKQPNVLSLGSPMIIIGDIHGQFYDLLNILQKYSVQQNNFLFLGDYVDRGQFCLQVLTLLMVLKIQYPNSIHLLRGNHESKAMTSQYNFKLQCCKKYSVDIYEKCLDWFKFLPLAAIVDKKYFCVHGGISPDFESLSQLQRIRRNIQVPEKGLFCDLLWSDPIDDDRDDWENNSLRGTSYYFSRSLASKFLKMNSFKMIIRAHELQDQGNKFQKDSKKSSDNDAFSLTLFSAPNYCDKFKNKGAVAILKNNTITIETFNEMPHPMVLPNCMNVFQWTLPFVFASVEHLFKRFVGQQKGKNSQLQSIKQIQKEMQQYEKLMIIKAMFNKAIIDRDQPFPKKQIGDKEDVQQNRIIENKSIGLNEENLSVPGPFNLKFLKMQRKVLKSANPQKKSLQGNYKTTSKKRLVNN